MATMKIKDLYNLVESPFVLDPTMTYPEIEGDEANFLTEYNTNKAEYDRYFLKEHGTKIVDVEGDTDADIILNWKAEIKAIQRIYLNAWAHIFYTLNIAYNPVFNVEEHTTTKYGEHETEREYGEHETETEYGEHETENEYGATSETLGTHTDTTTEYVLSYDSGVEKESGKTSDVVGAQTNTSLTHTDTETSKLHTDTTTSKLHTDTETSKLHTDTVDRTGNIGIKSASALAEEEILLRERQTFFKNVFLTISREVGAYYDNSFI